MKLHPVISLCFLTIIFLMVLLYDNPIYIIFIFMFLVFFMLILRRKDLLKKTITYGLFNMFFIVIINAFISQSGRTILFRSVSLPIIGRLRVSGESLAYGGNMGLKLICILMIFFIYSIMTDSEDTFSFFSKFAHKLTLIFSMTINIIHRLNIEVLRVKDVMQMRGVSFKDKKLLGRVKAYYPLLKVIFISALEGSIDRAEALHSRHFGMYKRTSYSQLNIRFIDYAFITISVVLLGVLMGGVVLDMGTYTFYPNLETLKVMDILWLKVIGSIFIAILFFLWGCRNWTFLKYRV